MNKLILLSVFLAALTACKKDYTCTCSSTAISTANTNTGMSTATSTNSITTSTVVSTTTFDATKSNATKQCTALSNSNVTPPVNCSIK